MDEANGTAKDEIELMLTFDDGPHEIWTGKLLSLLGEFDVKAVFFLVGKQVEKNPAMVEQILEQGHVVGNHTWSHRLLLAASQNVIEREVFQFDDYFINRFGHKMKLFRPPWGVLSRRHARLIEKHCGYENMLWDVDSMDYVLPIARHVSILKQAAERKKTIILMHDGAIFSPVSSRNHTVKMVEKLLQHKGRNLKFTTPFSM